MISRLERRADPAGHEHRAHGQPAGERLRQGEDVGDDSGLLVGEQGPGAAEAALHLIEDQGDAAGVTQLPQESEPLGVERANPSLSLHRLDDHARRPGRRDRMVHRRPIPERDDPDAGHERLERLAVFGPVGSRERREQPAVERPAERDDLGLPRPLARELERGLVRLRPRVAEEDTIGERAGHQLLGQPLARLRAIEVGHMNQPGGERALDRPADHGMIVAEGVDPDPGDEVQVTRAVLCDELHAFPPDEHGTDPGIHAQQRLGGRGDVGRRGEQGAGWARSDAGHARCIAGATIAVPATG